VLVVLVRETEVDAMQHLDFPIDAQFVDVLEVGLDKIKKKEATCNLFYVLVVVATAIAICQWDIV